MARAYLINCGDLGVRCEFQARGSSEDEVLQRCADHGAVEHGMKAFGPALYLKMRRHIRTLENALPLPAQAPVR